MKVGIIRNMRFLTVMAFLPMMAFGVSIGSLPVSGYADTEVSTNIPFAVDLVTMSRVEFSLSLDASPTNCVEVSIGEDADDAWNLVKVTRRGVAAIGEVTLVEGRKPGFAVEVR